MKTLFRIILVSVIFSSGLMSAQKVKYTKDELKHLKGYYFNEGFDKPATKKVSTVIMKDGQEKKGYCKNIKTKKLQIHTLVFEDEVSGQKMEIPATDVKEARLFASGFEKWNKAGQTFSTMGHKRGDVKKKTTNGEIYFINQSVSLKNKKDEREFLMQLINPEFDDIISVYHDPLAIESGGVNIGGAVTVGGGVLKSYYIKKGDRVFWLKKGDFKKEYDFLFGDNPEFMKKYPYKSVNWDWFSALVLEYTKMSLQS